MPEVLATFSPLQIALLRQIGTRLLDGCTTREIADELAMSVSWLDTLVSEMRSEFNAGKEGKPHDDDGS
jgi:hypothetical protein